MGRSAFKSLGAVIALLFWSAAPVVQALHGSHSHRYCAEHQAFEEASAKDAANKGQEEKVQSGLSGDHSSDVEASTSDVDLLEGDHQLCLACSNSGVESCPVRSSLLALAIHWNPTAESGERKLSLRPMSPLTSAPKSSPPA